jgi:uncharacterized protein YdeI (BOF family)
MKKSTVTVSLNLTYDAWRDLEGALMERAAQAKDHAAMRDRLNAMRLGIEEQVRQQHPRWRA